MRAFTKKRGDCYNHLYRRALGASLLLQEATMFGINGTEEEVEQTSKRLLMSMYEIVQLLGDLEDSGILEEKQDYRKLVTEIEKLLYPHEY